MIFHSLIGRLGSMLIIATMVPIVLIGFITYQYIYIDQVNRVEDDLHNRVVAESTALEGLLDDLSNASQMLVVDGGMGRNVIDYLAESDAYNRALLFARTNQSLINIYLSNLSLGAVFFYFPNQPNHVQFANMTIKDPSDIFKRPSLYRANDLTYYGPHESIGAGEPELVFSLIRMLRDDQGESIYVYLEIKLASVIQNMFSQNTVGMLVNHTMTSADGVMQYSDAKGDLAHYHSITSTSDEGWTLSLLIPTSEYNQEIRKWYNRFLFISGCSLTISMLLAYLIWRMVSHPLRQIKTVIKRFTINLSDESEPDIRLIEFKDLLYNFVRMRDRIVELISEVEAKEKRKGELEVEKLLVQINPHFIHNTLNTIQWLARMHGQTDIAKLVTIFTRVLHYNLGKKSMIVKVAEEVRAIRDYVELQQIRYDHKFDVRVVVAAEVEQVPLPRFVLQPLVENALYHGLENSDGYIEVFLSKTEDNSIQLVVADSGKGMSEEQIAMMKQGKLESEEKIGLGIGLRYVFKMINTYYGDRAQFLIDSKVGKGTKITIIIPDHM
ncbi:sensor histidine kinase [Paenibacillus sp. FJAT-27812]|uniref:sensor histidine kinase n=1 Tax=Paenibacillus sp. FJAT-27812 TaxID=1684143 RepID=UPI0006A780F3|nr:histidine kinase [Paenibacillus sp. FJAT-27812]